MLHFAYTSVITVNLPKWTFMTWSYKQKGVIKMPLAYYIGNISTGFSTIAK